MTSEQRENIAYDMQKLENAAKTLDKDQLKVVEQVIKISCDIETGECK